MSWGRSEGTDGVSLTLPPSTGEVNSKGWRIASRLLQFDHVVSVINPHGGKLPENVLAYKAVNARSEPLTGVAQVHHQHRAFNPVSFFKTQIDLGFGVVAAGSGSVSCLERGEIRGHSGHRWRHDGVICAGVEQEHGGLSVDLGIEQDHAVDAMEGNAVHVACFLCQSERRKQKQKRKDVAYCVAYQPGERGLTRENEGD